MNTDERKSAKSDKYEVFLDSQAERDLDTLSPTDLRRVDQRILKLQDTPRPRGAKKLGKNYYRIRVGPWRIIYNSY